MALIYLYDKSFNIVPAAQVFNMNNTSTMSGNPTGWFDLTDYKGNTLRFHTEDGSGTTGGTAHNATQTGNSIPNTFTDYKGDPGNGGEVPPNIIMININHSVSINEQSNYIVNVINGPIGFGQFGNTMIAVGYEGASGQISTPADYNFYDSNGAIGTSYSLNQNSWGTVNDYFAWNSPGTPTGNGFNNTEIAATANTSVSFLVMQNNPVKVNNTACYNATGGWYQDGNHPISYGEASSNSMFLAENGPNALVGGKFEAIKSHYPFNSTGVQNSTQKPTNIASGSKGTVGNLNSGEGYKPSLTSKTLCVRNDIIADSGIGGGNFVGGALNSSPTVFNFQGPTWDEDGPDS